MAFHEVRFPDNISRGARGGPERRTQIVELASGDEERNSPWADSRRRYDAAYGIRRADDLAAVIAFFEARRGRLHGFRWKDWADYKSWPAVGASRRRSTSSSVTGDGDDAPSSSWSSSTPAARSPGAAAITKPVAGTVLVALGGVRRSLRLVGRCHAPASSPSPPRPAPASSSPPASSSTCRSASTPTELDGHLDIERLGSITSIPLVEVRR